MFAKQHMHGMHHANMYIHAENSKMMSSLREFIVQIARYLSLTELRGKLDSI